jgi:hypothetical protein
MVAPATTALGSWVNANWVGDPALTAKLVEAGSVVTPLTVVLGVNV